MLPLRHVAAFSMGESLSFCGTSKKLLKPQKHDGEGWTEIKCQSASHLQLCMRVTIGLRQSQNVRKSDDAAPYCDCGGVDEDGRSDADLRVETLVMTKAMPTTEHSTKPFQRAKVHLQMWNRLP